jgi:hypothetical protein
MKEPRLRKLYGTTERYLLERRNMRESEDQIVKDKQTCDDHYMLRYKIGLQLDLMLGYAFDIKDAELVDLE